MCWWLQEAENGETGEEGDRDLGWEIESPTQGLPGRCTVEQHRDVLKREISHTSLDNRLSVSGVGSGNLCFGEMQPIPRESEATQDRRGNLWFSQLLTDPEANTT